MVRESPEAGLPPGEPDGELLQKAGGGDEAAFEALYRRWRGYVMALAARFGLADDEAQDVLQETFFYVIRKLPGLRLRARFSTFLYPVVKHLALKRRRAGRQVPVGGSRELEPLAGASGGESTGEAGSVEEMLAALSRDHREVLLLRFVDGFSLEEVAAALDIPQGTAKSRLHYALEALRRGRSSS